MLLPPLLWTPVSLAAMCYLRQRCSLSLARTSSRSSLTCSSSSSSSNPSSSPLSGQNSSSRAQQWAQDLLQTPRSRLLASRPGALLQAAADARCLPG